MPIITKIKIMIYQHIIRIIMDARYHGYLVSILMVLVDLLSD